MFLHSNWQLVCKLEQLIVIVEESTGKDINDLVEDDLIGLCKDTRVETRVKKLGFWVLEMKLTFSKELQ
jgi:hypothetical protein